MILKKKQKGFTLVEMMVSVSIFVIVAFIVTSLLITMSASYKRALKMRLIMDNLNFALQSMALELREGSGYNCDNTSCSFLPRKKSLVDGPGTDNPDYTCYALDNKVIVKCEDQPKDNTCGACLSGSDRVNFVSGDVLVDKLFFKTFPPDGKRVFIQVSGSAQDKPRPDVQFDIQTNIMQRNSG